MAARWRVQRLPSASPGAAFAARAAAILLAIVIASVILASTGADPLALGRQVLRASFGSAFGMEDLGVLVTPLILTGLAVATARQIGAWNIGAEGQLYAGAFAAAAVGLFMPGPNWLILILMFLAGLIGGAAWILLPTLARAYAGVSELITTLLLNFVGILLVHYFSTSAWRDRSSNSTTARIEAEIPELWGTVHWGLVVAIVAALLLAAVLAFSRWGYEVRLVGSNPAAAHYAGMPVRRRLITIMLLSGAVAGLAGMIEVAGTVHRLQSGVSTNFGYLGIMVAVLARSSALGVVFSGALMAFILNSGVILQTQGLTTSAVLAVTGLILFLTAIGDELSHYRVRADKA